MDKRPSTRAPHPRSRVPIDEVEELVRSLYDDVEQTASAYNVSLIPDLAPVQPAPDETTVIERPMWHAFVLCVQLHNLALSSELEPAHRIGTTARTRVTLSVEAIDALNYFINHWYGNEVELITTELADPKLVSDSKGVFAFYDTPYRPVTGLRLIVTPTYQWASDSYSKRVLEARAEWGATSVMDGLSSARRLYIQERVRVIKKKPLRRLSNPISALWSLSRKPHH